MYNIVNKLWIIIFLIFMGTFADTKDSSGGDFQKAVVFSRAAFVFPTPDETVEIVKMLRKGQFVTLLDKKVDSLDRMWYKLKDKAGDSGWVESQDLRVITGSTEQEKPEENIKTISKLTRRQRMRYIKDNPTIDYRTKKMIKDGFVGMGMKTADVRGSLGPPDAVKTVMLQKSEERTIWIYRLKDPVVFVFKGDIVTGWSMD